MRSLVPSLLVLSLVPGCGEVENSSPTKECAPACTTPGPGPAVDERSAVGSHELVFDTVERTDGKTSSLVPLPDPRASIGNRARLDIVTTDGKLEFALTPRWGTRHVFSTVTVTPGAFELTDVKPVEARAGFSVRGETNIWESVRVPRKADGSLYGVVTATGKTQASAGDVVDEYPVRGTAHLVADGLAPEVRITPPQKSRGGKWLPWDPIVIQLAEPLAGDLLWPAVAAAFPDVGFPPVGDVNADPKAQTTGYYGVATKLTVSGATRTFAVAAGSAKDPSGNPIAAYSGSVVYHDLGAALAAHDFIANAPIAVWGDAVLVTDARCRVGGTGSCAVITAPDQNRCETASGLAGKLVGTGKKTNVHALVRYLAATDKLDTDNPPYLLSPIRLLAAAGWQMTFGTEKSQAKLAKTGDPEMPWSTDWIQIDATTTATADEIGFALVRPECDSGGGLPGPQARIVVVVDRVWID